LYILGTLLIFASATIFLFGVQDILVFKGLGETHTKPTMMQQYGWVIESVIFAVLGSAFVWAGERLRKREDEEGSLVYLAVTPVASLLALFTIPVFIFGLHGAINPGYDQVTYEWIIETILFGGLAVAAFVKLDSMRFAEKEEESWKPYPLFAAGYAFLIPAFFIFIFWVAALMTNNFHGDEVWRTLVELLIFAVLGFASFYLIDHVRRREKGKKSVLPYALAPGGYLFLFAATIALVFGFSAWLRADINASTYRSSFSWIVEVILFGLMGFACLTFSDRIKNRIEKVKRDLPMALSICGILLWIVSMGFYFGVVETSLKPVPDVKVFVEFLAYGLIGLGAIVYSDNLKKDDGYPKERVLPKLLSLSGGLLLLVTLLMFVAGLHEFVNSTSPDFKWLMRDIAYGIAGAVYLVLGNWMEPLLSKKKEKARGKLLEKTEEKNKEK
jgi:membrane protein implicated in regulation of membrane protease activity